MTTETDKTTQERESFEAWWDNPIASESMLKGMAWEGWQARAALDTGGVPVLDPDLVQRCREVVDWKTTALLHGGEGGALRAFADTLHGSNRGDVRHAEDVMLYQLAEAVVTAPQTPASADEDVDRCPVCAEPIRTGDTCATDIEMGTCHAACLEGSPVVDLETGAPSDGPVTTFVREAELPPASASAEPLTIVYHNWRGETATRRVIPQHVYFGSTEWHPKPQWVMRALDVDKGEVRDFAMRDMERACCEGGSDCTCHEQDASASAGKVEPVPEKRGSASVPMTVCHECGESLAESDAQWTDDGSPFCKHHSFDPAPAQPVAVSVKPLEWPQKDPTYDAALTTLGTWWVIRGKSGWAWRREEDAWSPPFHTESAAKSAAQTDYEHRIRSALVIEPAPPDAYRQGAEEMRELCFGAVQWLFPYEIDPVNASSERNLALNDALSAIRAIPLPGDKEG